MACDPHQALDALIALGIERVLTSGQETSALEGLDLIADLIRQATGRIVVMPGGGINERNIARIVAGCGAGEVHISGRKTIDGPMIYRRTHVNMGAALRPAEFTRTVVDAGRIWEVREALNEAKGGDGVSCAGGGATGA